MIGKEHKNLLRDIAGYVKIIEASSELKFEPAGYGQISPSLSQKLGLLLSPLLGNYINRPKTGLSCKTRRYSFSPKMDSVNHLVMKAMRFTHPKVGVSEFSQNIQAGFVDNGHATRAFKTVILAFFLS